MRQCFATPHERRQPLRSFFELLRSSREESHSPAEVPYVQHQNNNLTHEFQKLLADVDADLPFARETFGTGPPDAVNLWIGDDRSVTSFHKDHYENLYAQIRGTKIFTLLPPCEVYRMHMRTYPAATYAPGAGGRLVPVLQQPQRMVAWCPVDPCAAEEPAALALARKQYPLFFDPGLPLPLQVELSPGELLYLPSMWYHHVQQRVAPGEDAVVAVNMWYDMVFDLKWAYCRLVERLSVQLGLMPQPPADASSGSDTNSPSSEDVGEDGDARHTD